VINGSIIIPVHGAELFPASGRHPAVWSGPFDGVTPSGQHPYCDNSQRFIGRHPLCSASGDGVRPSGQQPNSESYNKDTVEVSHLSLLIHLAYVVAGWNLAELMSYQLGALLSSNLEEVLYKST